MLIFDNAPNENHGCWLGEFDSYKFIPLAEDKLSGSDRQERFLEAMLDSLASGHVCAGSFLASESDRIIVPAGALKHAQSGASFEIHPKLVLGCDAYGETYGSLVLHVVADPVALNLWSIARACNAPFPVKAGLCLRRDLAVGNPRYAD